MIFIEHFPPILYTYKVVVKEENMSDEHGMTPRDDENVGKESIQSESEEQKEFSFLQETIKDEQPSGKRTFYRIIKVSGFGVVFGLAACIAFYALKPWVETKFQKDPSEIVIPKDSEEEQGQEEKTEEEPVQQELTIENYREMYNQLYDVASAANKSIVEVTGILEDDSWMDMAYDNNNSVSGIYIGDNGQETLVLTYSSILKGAESIKVTFSDNQTYTAKIKKADENLGLVVVSVEKNKMKKNTLSSIEEAVLGNSNLLAKGEAVIALGKHFGYSGSMGYGVVSSTRNAVMRADGVYSIISTDITTVSNGTGVLVNLKGEIIGLIDQTISSEDSMSLVTAYAISDLKDWIERLSNGKGVPYIGIVGADITEAAAKEQDMPEGVYVKEVNPDSPAMNAGIKSGDIMTSFKDKDITSLSAYQSVLKECNTQEKIKIKGKRLGPEGYVDISFEVTIGSKE